MKTSELKKIIKENGIAFDEYDTNISFNTGCGKFTIYKKLNELEIEEGTFNSNDSDFLENIIKYVKTPLEEREEEKKYYLKMPKEFHSKLGFRFYVELHDNCYIIVKETDIKKEISEFTQKEIDAMPFDTNFFIKEEVK